MSGKKVCHLVSHDFGKIRVDDGHDDVRFRSKPVDVATREFFRDGIREQKNRKATAWHKAEALPQILVIRLDLAYQVLDAYRILSAGWEAKDDSLAYRLVETAYPPREPPEKSNAF
jgi:hypothetical protein